MEKEQQRFEHETEGVTVTFEVPLPDALVAKVGESRIIRSIYLGSSEKLKNIIQYTGSKRISLVQYNIQEGEWEKIAHEHQSLLKVDPEHVHLTFPVLPPLFQKPQRAPTYHEREIADKLPKLLNMEGWSRYTMWMNERFEQALKKFSSDALDEYTLEALLGKIRNEVFSELLAMNLANIRELDLELAHKHAQGIYEGTIDDEKKLIKLREEIHQMIASQYEIFENIVTNMKSIEKSHPELTTIEDLSVILQSLLENQLKNIEQTGLRWGAQEMLLELFDDALEIQPILNCSKDHGRSLFALAIRLAILQLKQSHPVRELIEMISAWDETCVAIAKGHAKGMKYAPLIKKIRKLVLENLKQIQHVRSTLKKEPLEEGLIPNLELLTYLPHDKNLVTYDVATGKPTGITEEGRKLLATIT